MATTKRIGPSPRRYVAQQESYLMRPQARPVAQPIEATPEPAREDGKSMRLREISQALSAGSKALTDFYTMEKSFEETNRLENQVRAQMGLPPADGRGHLKYGSRAGYLEGKGILKGQQAMVELNARIAQMSNNLDLDNLPTPQEMRDMVDRETAQVISGVLGTQVDEAELRGASPLLVQAKLENRVKALDALRAAEERAQLQHASQFISNQIEHELLPKMYATLLAGNPLDASLLREEISQLTAVARDTYDIDRDVATAATLENFLGIMAEKGVMSLAPSGDLGAIMDLEKIMEAAVKSFSLPDSSGISISQIKTPEVKAAMDQTLRLVDNYRTRAEFVRGKLKELEGDLALSDGVKHLLDGGTVEEVQDSLMEAVRSGSMDARVALETINTLRTTYERGDIVSPNIEEFRSWQTQAASGRLNPLSIYRLQIEKGLPDYYVRNLLTLYDAGIQASDRIHVETERAFSREERLRILSEREAKDTYDSNQRVLLSMFQRNAIEPDSPVGRQFMTIVEQVYPINYMRNHPMDVDGLERRLQSVRDNFVESDKLILTDQVSAELDPQKKAIRTGEATYARLRFLVSSGLGNTLEARMLMNELVRAGESVLGINQRLNNQPVSGGSR